LPELLKAVRLLGPRRLLKMARAYRFGWDEMIRGYWATPAMQVFLQVGLVDAMIDAPVDVRAFASTHNLDPLVLVPLVEAMYSIGIFDESGERYTLSRRGRNMIDVLRGWFNITNGYSEVFASLEPMVRGYKVYGRDFYRKSGLVAQGSGEMENLILFPQCNEIIKERGYKRVLDLGCGDGTFLRKLCELNPEVKCFGIDLSPDAVKDGQKLAADAGVSDRISLHAADVQDVGDMPEELTTVEVATIYFVLHEILWLGEDKLLAFLRAYRQKFPQAPLIAFEAIRPTKEQMRKREGIAVYYYLYHDLTQQKPVSRDAWKNLFSQAGFTSIEERYLDFARTAIYILH
jgi:SAM-dependent methyltransferase